MGHMFSEAYNATKIYTPPVKIVKFEITC